MRPSTILRPSLLLCAALGASTLAPAGAAGAGEHEFGYSGDAGPDYWAELSPEWSACAGAAEDARQSPVDLRQARFDRSLGPLALRTRPTHVDIVNNGHTIEQHYEGTGSAITFEGRSYELQQFHFHTLSEHAIAGARGAMELHAVFAEEGSERKLVLAVLFDIGRKPNHFLQVLIDAGLPKKDGSTRAEQTPVNLADALTGTASYYTYAGSLTTPPCSETVTWVVLAKPAEMTPGQHLAFRRILGNDFRPLQDLKGRVVRSTNVRPQHHAARGAAGA